MSTITFDHSSAVDATAAGSKHPSLFERFMLRRDRAAKTHITAFFAGLSDERLVDLGFDAADIAAIRRGEHRLPKAFNKAA